jgi:hypothetical protein
MSGEGPGRARPGARASAAESRVPGCVCLGLTERWQNATFSITLHSVSKLRLPLSIREYSGHYTEAYTWK